MRSSDWSSDVCSSDLPDHPQGRCGVRRAVRRRPTSGGRRDGPQLVARRAQPRRLPLPDHGARAKEWHWPQALRGVRNSAAAQVSARDRPALRTVRPPPPRPRPGAVDALMDARASETSPAAPEFDLELRGKTRRSIGWTITRTLSDQLFSFTVFVVLAQLLTREEIGIFAMAYVFAEIGRIVATSGLSQLIARAERIEPKLVDTVFWTNQIGRAHV